jgi:hypothetical protein
MAHEPGAQREERMRRMRVVKARPRGWEKVRYCGESTLL